MNNDLALQSLVESLQETLRKERIRTETLELENAQLHARVVEFEASPTVAPPPPSERSTARGDIIATAISELKAFRIAVGELSTQIETSYRMSLETRKTVLDDMPAMIEDAVNRAAANVKIEFATELQKAKTISREAREFAEQALAVVSQ
jgi:hypothetical protein